VLVAIGCALIVAGPIQRNSAGVYSVWSAADLLAIGCITAIVANKVRHLEWPLYARRALRWVGALGILAVFSFTKHDDADVVMMPTLMALATAVFLIGSDDHQPSRPRERVFWTLEAFGRASYEIYIFHFAIFNAMASFGMLQRVTRSGMPPLLAERAGSAKLNRAISGVSA
jgi:peptidoglycan/LPS O-acetylase OafA/YrhL